jgi:flavin reductase (DIM6/NTAB) family NADH-FMN oxidoreductase RutF
LVEYTLYRTGGILVDRPMQDREAILGAMSHLSHGVYVLGTRRGREMTAMTAAWVAQVSERPPSVVVAVRDDRYTHGVILESATFSLSVLRDDQVDVATHFAETSGEYHDKLYGIPYGQSPSGSPVLLDCLAYLDCKLLDTAHAGDHTVFIGEVIAGEVVIGESYDEPSYPLLYDPTEYEGALN